MKIVFCGGGTAGHITPALAIAQEVKKEYKDPKILFIGRNCGRENTLIEKEGYDLKTISIAGLQRKFTVKNLDVLKNTIRAYKRSKEILKEFNPDIVFGTGGYVCLPVIMAAKKIGIKTIIHESNAIAGLTTKLLSAKVDKVLLNFEDAKNNLSKKATYAIVGNPINENFYKLKREEARRKLGLKEGDFFILSFGGSLGSSKMNDVIITVMKRLSIKENSITHLHATGERYYKSIKEKNLTKENEKYKIVSFIEDISHKMPAADLVISRCGAMTISEICASGVASILIPSPNVTDNHQLQNAKLLEKAKAAFIIEEEKVSAEDLEKLIITLKNNKFDRKNVAKNAKSLFLPNAAKLILKEIKSLTN